MSRPMINATLFNVDNGEDEYVELRRHMVDEVTAEEMNQPAHILRDLLEDYVWRMFDDMDDDSLQDHYDLLMNEERIQNGMSEGENE